MEWNNTPHYFYGSLPGQRTRSLDYDHGSEHLAKVAAWQDGAHQERQYAWYEAALARLFWGEMASVIWGLQRMQPTDAQAATADQPPAAQPRQDFRHPIVQPAFDRLDQKEALDCLSTAAL